MWLQLPMPPLLHLIAHTPPWRAGLSALFVLWPLLYVALYSYMLASTLAAARRQPWTKFRFASQAVRLQVRCAAIWPSSLLRPGTLGLHGSSSEQAPADRDAGDLPCAAAVRARAWLAPSHAMRHCERHMGAGSLASPGWPPVLARVSQAQALQEGLLPCTTTPAQLNSRRCAQDQRPSVPERTRV